MHIYISSYLRPVTRTNRASRRSSWGRRRTRQWMTLPSSWCPCTSRTLQRWWWNAWRCIQKSELNQTIAKGGAVGRVLERRRWEWGSSTYQRMHWCRQIDKWSMWSWRQSIELMSKIMFSIVPIISLIGSNWTNIVNSKLGIVAWGHVCQNRWCRSRKTENAQWSNAACHIMS